MNDLQKLMHLMQTNKFKVTSLSRDTKQNNCHNSKTQEYELVCQLNDLITKNKLNLIAVLSCDNKSTGMIYNTKLDLCLGDIFIYNVINGKITGKPVMYIDVKIAFISQYHNVFATITRRSFDNFANVDDHYYWCFNMDGSMSVLIDTIMFYKYVNDNQPWNKSKKPGCENNRNEAYIMGKWINKYRKHFEVHI